MPARGLLKLAKQVVSDLCARRGKSCKAINSKMPLRPPKMVNCGMGLKRQETDHTKRKTKARPKQHAYLSLSLRLSLSLSASFSVDVYVCV